MTKTQSLRHSLTSLSAFGCIAFTMWSSSAHAADTITVNPATKKQTLASTFQGINYVGFWDPIQGSAASAQGLAQTSTRLVRFPGGDPGDWYDWQCPYYTGSACPATPNASSWSTTSPADLWTYAGKMGGATLFLQTNYQGNVPNPPGKSYAANSPENAGAYATYVKQQGMKAIFEIGNEEDIHMTSSHDSNFSPYITAFNAQAQAIHAVDATLKVFGPAGTNEWFWWALDSLGMFLQQTGNKTGSGKVDGVSLHFYKGTNWADSMSVAQYWLSSTGPWNFIQTTIKANDTRPLPVFISEWHIGASDSSFDPTMGNALVTADMIGAFALSGVAGEQYFAMHGAGGGSNQYGVFYGSGDSRAADSGTPVFYAMALLGHFGTDVVDLTQTAKADTEVSSYATTKSDGSIQVLAINKTASAQSLALTLSGYNTAGHNVHIYSVVPSAGTSSTDVNYNGVKNPDPKVALPAPATQAAASGLAYNLPAYSIALLEFDGSGGGGATDGGTAGGGNDAGTGPGPGGGGGTGGGAGGTGGAGGGGSGSGTSADGGTGNGASGSSETGESSGCTLGGGTGSDIFPLVGALGFLALARRRRVARAGSSDGQGR